MPKERFKIIPSVYLVLIKDGKIFLARRCNTGFHDGEYSFPAGHLEGNETLAQAAAREGQEEVGVIAAREDLRLVHVNSRNSHDGERVGFFFQAVKWEGEPKIMEPDKCDGIGWFPLDSLPGNTIDYIKGVIADIRNGKAYSEFGWKL